MAGPLEEGKMSLAVQASFTFTNFDRKVDKASSMTCWNENHSADNFVLACIIRLHTTTLKRCMLPPASSDRESLKENEWLEREAVQN